MVIVIKSDKVPTLSKKARIWQGENLAEDLVIYASQIYDETDISDFTATICYVDPGNIFHSEALEKCDESDKEGYIKFSLPINTDITKLAGDMSIYFSFTKVDDQTQEGKVIHTATLNIKIEPWGEHFVFVPPSGLNAIDQRILEVQNEINEAKSMQDIANQKQVDDVVLDVNDRLHVSAGGKVLGKGVEIIVPTVIDSLVDDKNDGIVDVTDVTESTEIVPNSGYEFVDYDHVDDYDTSSNAPQNQGTQFIEL